MPLVTRAGRRAALLCPASWCVLLALWIAMAASARADEPAPPDSARAAVCQDLLEAFASGDVAILREVLAPRDVRLTLPALEEERQRAVDGRFSADQAALVLVERFDRELPSAPTLGPDTMRSSDGTLAARCPVFDPTEGSVFMVIHYALGTVVTDPRAQVEQATGRLYLDLHLDSTTSRWQVRAVRELR